MRVKKAVLPVAGMGTRFLPATKASPKEMLPIVDKPMIQYVVEEAIASGITEIIMITGRGKRAIEDHFDEAYELQQMLEQKGKQAELKLVKDISEMCSFCYIRQKAPRGLGHAILCAKDVIGNDPFAVLLGDDLMCPSNGPALKELIDVFDETGSSVIGLKEVPEEKLSSYGVINGEPAGDKRHRINGLVEKPAIGTAPSNLAVIGRYVLTPAIFELLEQTERNTPPEEEVQLTDALNLLCQQDAMYGMELTGTRHDGGNKLGFLKATVEFALKREDLGEEFRQYLKSLNL